MFDFIVRVDRQQITNPVIDFRNCIRYSVNSYIRYKNYH